MPEVHGRQLFAGRSSRAASVGSSQAAGVRLVTLGDGVERGVRVLEFRTGTGFEFDVVVDRAFDIGRCEHAGRALAWTSATGFAGPWYYEPEGLGLVPRLRRRLADDMRPRPRAVHGGGHGRAVPLPAEADRAYGLHGRVSNRPARLAGYGERWDGDECVLYAEGEVLQAAVFGEQLLLRRRIEARVGESRLLIHDEVVNIGHDPPRTCFSTTSTSAGPSSTRGRSCSCPRRRSSRAATTRSRATHARRAGAASSKQVFEHEVAAEADGTVPVGDRQPPARAWRLRGLPPRPAPAPLRLAHARRGHVRGRHRAEHEPHRRPARRARARAS